MARSQRAWLWVVLSIPSTVIAFAVFLLYVRKGDKEIERIKMGMLSRMGWIFSGDKQLPGGEVLIEGQPAEDMISCIIKRFRSGNSLL